MWVSGAVCGAQGEAPARLFLTHKMFYWNSPFCVFSSEQHFSACEAGKLAETTRREEMRRFKIRSWQFGTSDTRLEVQVEP